MKPGRELDALVAEKVMGFADIRRTESITPELQWILHLENGAKIGGATPLPEYSTDIAAAFEVVAKIMPTYKTKVSIETYDGEIWSIKPCGTSSESLSHAICLAALKAMGVPLT